LESATEQQSSAVSFCTYSASAAEGNPRQLIIRSFFSYVVKRTYKIKMEIDPQTKLNFVAIFETISVALYQPGARNVCRQALAANELLTFKAEKSS
jgi:hypothetical protein